jgi:PEP-CTERM motif
MMHKSLITTLSALATVALLSITTAHAATYKFAFESNDAELTAIGQFTVDAAEQVTNISGVISGLTNQTISAVTANPSFPGPAYSPDGSFIYNNVYYPTGMAFDTNGVLFTTAQNPGGYWNLWGSSPGDYTLYESAGSYNYPIQEVGSLRVVATPEPSTWAMLVLGFAGLGLVGRRRRTARLAPGLG